jgi:hypothetical protein
MKGWYVSMKDGRFAGEGVGLSTGICTPVENVENDGTQTPHSGTFLLKMGKVVSATLVAERYPHCNAVHGVRRYCGGERSGLRRRGIVVYRASIMVDGAEMGAPVAFGSDRGSTGRIAKRRKDWCGAGHCPQFPQWACVRLQRETLG